MFKKSKHIKNLICIFVSIALANILSVTAHADVFDTLRPETSKSSIKDELEKKATTKETTPPPEPRVRFEGHGTAREAVVAGSAAALYHYSIDEVVKSLRPQDIPSELARMETFLSNLPAEVEKAVELTPDVKGEIKNATERYRKKIQEEYEDIQRRIGSDEKIGFIEEGFAKLLRLISSDEGWYETNEAAQRAFKILVDYIEQSPLRERVLVRFKDPDNPTEEEKRLLEGYTDERGEWVRGAAEREYIRFLDALQKHMNFYENLIKDADKRIDYQRKKKTVFEHRIAELDEHIRAEVDPKDELELEAVNKRIARRRADREEIEERIENLINDKGMYDVCLMVFKSGVLGFKDAGDPSLLRLETHEIFEVLRAQLEGKTAEIKGKPFEGKMPTPAVNIDNIKQKNISAADIIFEETYNPKRKYFESLDQRLSAGEKLDRSEAALLETRDALADLIIELREITGYELNISEHSESQILFCDKEIPVSSLHKICNDYQIRAIFTTKGGITTHWVLIASGRGIPVVIYKPERPGETVDIYKIVKPGDETILETNGQGEGTVIIRPDGNDRKEAAQLSFEYELEYNFALSRAGEKTPLKVYANIASVDDTKSASERMVDGVGLYRTELILSPLIPEAESYIKAVLQDSEDLSAHRKALLLYLKQDLLEHIKILRKLAKERGLKDIPFTIRFFDIEKDKNRELLDLLPEDQRKTGLGFYRTKVGRALLLVQAECIIDVASEESGKENEINVDLGAMFPMVSRPEEIDWVERNIIAYAYSNVLEASRELTGEGRQLVFKGVLALPHLLHLDALSLGIMAETKEVSQHIYEILDRNISFVSGGTNDWTQEILSEVFRLPVLREDEHFGKLYAELQPWVLTEINKTAQEIARWNNEHPDMPKKTLGFCGDLASREKFALYALYLERKFKLDVSLSTTPDVAPLMKLFLRHADNYLKDDELFSLFDTPLFKIDALASKKAEEVKAKIRDPEWDPDYYTEVTQKIEEHRRLTMPGEAESAHGINTDLTGEQQSLNAVASSA